MLDRIAAPRRVPLGPLDPDDVWDPRNWTLDEEREWRIYGNDACTIWAVVDEIDWHWAIQWKWSVKKVGSKSKGKRNNGKFYLYRNAHETTPPDGFVRRQYRVQHNLFLHVAIMGRKRRKPSSPRHTLIDHRDRDRLNCRRKNLRYVTPEMNNKRVKKKH